MKKPDITQGEWTVEKHDHIDGEVWLSINQGAIDVTHNVRDDQIASQKFSITDSDERIANAKAISAVPSMIDALIEDYEAFEFMYNLTKEAAISDYCHDRMESLKQALTKAGVEL